jgi:GAF domain-containing protein
MKTTSDDQLTRISTVLRRFAGTLVGEYELDDVMSQLGDDVATVLGAAGAGVMLSDAEGLLRFVSTSDPVLDRLEKLQIDWDEGPCLLAYRTSNPVIAADLAVDDRFPSFGPQAVEEGMRAVWSFPMHLNGTTIGALNLYAEKPTDLGEEALSLGRTFADVATIYVVHARDVAEHEELTAGLQKALDTRIVIEQAKGFVAARRGIAPRAAFEVIRRYARSRSIKVRSVAEALVTGELAHEELGGHEH